jgi:hypothetical protein
LRVKYGGEMKKMKIYFLLQVSVGADILAMRQVTRVSSKHPTISKYIVLVLVVSVGIHINLFAIIHPEVFLCWQRKPEVG